MNLDFLKVTNQTDTSRPARLDLFGAIGGSFWDAGIDEGTVKSALMDIADDQPIDVYINSVGGSVFTALAIYNLLKRHKGEITITVAGLAASAATIITCVPGAKVIMPKGSVMLVHPVRSSAQNMTPNEMKVAAENLEKIRLSVRDIYVQKTGMNESELDEMMATESFLTAAEAVELGFADELDESQEVENSMMGDAVMVNGLQVSASLYENAPAGFIKAAPSAEKSESQEEQRMDLERLKAEHPEIVEAIRSEAMSEGAARERARIQAIEEIAVAGHNDLIQAAKFENGMTAEAVAVAILKAEKVRNAQMLKERQEDAQALAGIEAQGNQGIDVNAEAKVREDAEKQAFIEAAARAFERV